MLIPQVQILEDEAILGRLKRYSSDVDWIEERRRDLRGKYPDLFIAVKNHRVLFTAQSMTGIVKLIHEAGESAEDCAVEYISAQEMDLIL